MIEYKYILCGAFVGFMTGLTGIGGGSLMTPILILLLGFPPSIAVGTDLLFSSITKIVSVIPYHFKKHVDWQIVLGLAYGSVPAAVITILLLMRLHIGAYFYNVYVTKLIGLIILLSAIFHLLLKVFKKHSNRKVIFYKIEHQFYRKMILFFLGALIGAVVTLTSIGAGVLSIVVLMIFYSDLKPINLIAIELAHAIPIGLISGVAYIFLNAIDFNLLINLLTGSLPAAYLGSRFASKLPQKLLIFFLTLLLITIAMKMLSN